MNKGICLPDIMRMVAPATTGHHITSPQGSRVFRKRGKTYLERFRMLQQPIIVLPQDIHGNPFHLLIILAFAFVLPVRVLQKVFNGTICTEQPVVSHCSSHVLPAPSRLQVTKALPLHCLNVDIRLHPIRHCWTHTC